MTVTHLPDLWNPANFRTKCKACGFTWPCEQANHKGCFGYSAVHDEESWRCAPDCPHPTHEAATR